MRFALALCLAGLATPALVGPVLAATDHAALAARAIQTTIEPGFATLRENAADLATVTQETCATDGPINSAALRAAYDETFEAWARVDFLRLGPVEENNRGFAVEFWPDTKGATPRILAGLITAEDPVVDDPDAYAKLSIAARGLMALDDLLGDPDQGRIEGNSYRCRLLEAITVDLANTTNTIESGWHDPWARILTTAGAADNTVYLTPSELSKALYAALHDGLQADIDLRLGRPLGTFDRPQPRRAEAWRTERSLPNLTASIEALRAYAATVFGPELAPADAAAIDAAFESALIAASHILGPIDVEVAKPDGHFRVEALQSSLRRVQEAIGTRIPAAIGVAGGFNAMDGD